MVRRGIDPGGGHWASGGLDPCRVAPYTSSRQGGALQVLENRRYAGKIVSMAWGEEQMKEKHEQDNSKQ